MPTIISLTPAQRAELEPLPARLADRIDQLNDLARRRRGGGTSMETPRMAEMRQLVATKLDELADAEEAYRYEILSVLHADLNAR